MIFGDQFNFTRRECGEEDAEEEEEEEEEKEEEEEEEGEGSRERGKGGNRGVLGRKAVRELKEICIEAHQNMADLLNIAYA